MLLTSALCQKGCWTKSIFIKGLVLCRFIKAFSQSAVAPVGQRTPEIHPSVQRNPQANLSAKLESSCCLTAESQKDLNFTFYYHAKLHPWRLQKVVL